MSLPRFLQACFGLYLLIILVEVAVRRRFTHFLIELGLGAAVGLLATLIILTSPTRAAFGELSSLHVLGIMCMATICGIVARYVFYLEGGTFSWLDMLKPLSITPMVVMPLIGSLQWGGTLNTMQTVSFAFLAFQNGFFWQKVLEGAKPTVQNAVPAVLQEGK
jgi:hypothetical protein